LKTSAKKEKKQKRNVFLHIPRFVFLLFFWHSGFELVDDIALHYSFKK